MKNFAPHYYKDFHCLAGQCRHSCCEHWEIDIDSSSFAKYQDIKTDFGEKIRANIETSSGNCSFKLCENERCPFLNEYNLCDIILNLGEEYLCDICAIHPRFRHFYSDRIEVGLGLCCEEACRLILTDTKPFALISDDENYEKLSLDELSFICERNEIISLIENSGGFYSAVDKINSIYGLSAVNFDEKCVCNFYSALEMLDTAWKDKLDILNKPRLSTPNENAEKMFVNLYKYFIFRHLEDEYFYEGLAFSEISVKMIWAICERTDFSPENICEIARMYSSEIEYSDENVEKTVEFALAVSG